MTLQNLTLQNFRSYGKKTFTFSPQTTLIVGPNTAGKTNILEAIMMMATGKSFRADADREAITWGSDMSRVIALVANKNLDPSSVSLPSTSSGQARKKLVYPESIEGQSEAGLNFVRSPRSYGEQTELELVLTNGEVQGQKAPLKKYLVNGVARRAIDFVGNLRAVLFWPEHLELVTDSPSLRRKYLDSVLVQVDREYRRNLMSYERGLRQRNRLLDLINEGTAHRHQLLFWDQLLIKAGGFITDKREEYIDFINRYKMPDVRYQIEYDKSVISEARLEQYKDEEVAAKATLVGPHRDDFIIAKFPISLHRRQAGNFQFSKEENALLDLSKYGSRGEQRLAILWLKLAELLYIEQKTGDRPILLLDDIFSELDEAHRKLVIELIGRQQTIVTSADKEVLSFLLQKSIEVIELG